MITTKATSTGQSTNATSLCSLPMPTAASAVRSRAGAAAHCWRVC